MRLRHILVGVVIGAILLGVGGTALFVFGKKWAKGYVPSQVGRAWDHQVEMEGGVKVRSPYKLLPREIPLPEEARQSGMTCTQFAGGQTPVNIITQVAVFPPGATMELERMAAISEGIFESSMGELTDKTESHGKVLGVPSFELHGTLNRFNPPRRVRTLYFIIDRNFYFVNLSVPASAKESDTIWRQLVEGIHRGSSVLTAFPSKPVLPMSPPPTSGGPAESKIVPSTGEAVMPPGMKRRNLTPQ